MVHVWARGGKHISVLHDLLPAEPISATLVADQVDSVSGMFGDSAGFGDPHGDGHGR